MQQNQPFKVCPQCQTPTELHAQFCGSCGRQYRTQFAPPVQQTQVFTPPPYNPQVPPSFPFTAPLERFSDLPDKLRNGIFTMWGLFIACVLSASGSQMKGETEVSSLAALFSLAVFVIALILVFQRYRFAKIHGGVMLGLYALGILVSLTGAPGRVQSRREVPSARTYYRDNAYQPQPDSP